MSNNVSFSFFLKDFISSKLGKITAAADNMNAKFGQHQRGIHKSSGLIARKSKLLTYLQQRRDDAFSTAKIRQYNQMIYQTERRLHKLKNLPPLSLSQRFGRMANDMGSTIGQAFRLWCAFAAFEGVKGIVKLGMDMEQTRIVLYGLLEAIPNHLKAGNTVEVGDLRTIADQPQQSRRRCC